jgi:hypothetical protein
VSSALIAAFLFVVSPQPANPSQLQTWIEQLGSPEYSVRQDAVTKLYAAGPSALKTLEAAAGGDDYEAALRARQVIERISQLFFVGARVSLHLDKASRPWSESFDVQVRIDNPTAVPIRLPFLNEDRGRLDTTVDATQVGTIMDLADFLEVSGAEDHIALTLDDYRGREDIERSIDGRVYGEPSCWLQPGAHLTLNLQKFNRGWARYRMLRSGVYQIRFNYVPEWDVPELRAAGLGHVKSQPVQLEITTAAPQALIDARRPLDCALAVQGTDVVMTLISTHDRPIGVNLNLGDRRQRPFANVRWVWRSGSGSGEIDVTPKPAALTADKVRTLQPGQRVELLRMPLKDVLAGAVLPRGQAVELRGQYTNIFDLTLLRDAGVAPALATQLKKAMLVPMFVGQRTTKPIVIP